jgi:hypothetical protein
LAGEPVTIRWLLHPIIAALALLLLAVVLTAVASHGQVAGTLLLLVVAGTTAGFANSGST